MNFETTEDQEQLQDSLRRVLAAYYSFEQRRAIEASQEGWSPQAWKQLRQLGVTALAVPQAYGGLGGAAADLLPVFGQFGRSLVVEPLLASAVLAATALRLSGDEAASRDWLPRVASGEALLAFAHDEAGARHAPLWVRTQAQRSGSGWLLSGQKLHVLHGCLASRLVVSARVDGAPGDRKGLALFAVDPAASGVTIRPHRLIDGSLAAQVDFASAPAQPLGDPGEGGRAAAAIDGALRAGIAAVCAEAVGVMEAAHELTLNYLNTRQQFGKLIGTNQALRHRASEMLVGLETARSASIMAALAADDPASGSATADLHRAKMLMGRHGRFVTQQAIQLHGGIGMTQEYSVGHYHRRFLVLDQLFGDGDAHAARLMDNTADFI